MVELGRPELGPRHTRVAALAQRAAAHRPTLQRLLSSLYGDRAQREGWTDRLLALAVEAGCERSEDWRAHDAARQAEPRWYESEQTLGGVCYVDLFAGDLRSLRRRIPYFVELGLNYLHLMPCFASPLGRDDGGYAVSSYRDVRPSLGTMEDLRELSGELREHGISLALDLVLNHTSDEHAWARAALLGDAQMQALYRLFPDRRQPDLHERTLREIFPAEHPGAFTYRPEIACWVWTTFHAFQWDLNYASPAAFEAMAREMLFLGNVGAEVLRLDAVAFIWKELGTSCENLPQAHTLVQALNLLCRIAAPSLLFKSEAIVHPDEVARYVRPNECQLSYNPLLMALLWNSLATRKVRLLRQALATRFRIPEGCSWVNYVRCHDDIGWTFSDEDAAALGIAGSDHRRFLNDFYLGRFEGSFARGVPFQDDPRTGDCRVSGTCASLAGLERALEEDDTWGVELSIRRILLLHGVALSVGGIPLLYLGDEIGQLNDPSFRSHPDRAADSRWVHRPRMDWAKAERRHDPTAVEGRIFGGLRRLIAVRRQTPALGGQDTEVVETGSDHVLGYRRRRHGHELLVLANFSDSEQRLASLPGRGPFHDRIGGGRYDPGDGLSLPPYGLLWLS